MVLSFRWDGLILSGWAQVAYLRYKVIYGGHLLALLHDRIESCIR